MAILGIESLIYSVGDVEKSGRFFEDFGLRRAATAGRVERFDLPEGSHVLIRHRDDAALPQSSLVGDGVREVNYAHYVHNLPPFLMTPPAWDYSHITGIESSKSDH
jgi:catechol 2,3-dioxygenase-like lactoylglutathione lyase family enzyme